MAYVKRDSSGVIVAVSANADDQCTEFVEPTDPALRQFVADLSGDQSRLGATDQQRLDQHFDDLGERATWRPTFVFEESLKPAHLPEGTKRSHSE